MGKGKLAEELRQKVKAKLEGVREEHDKIIKSITDIQFRAETVNNQAISAASTFLREKNKEKVKSQFTDVMQHLEQCYNVLFLINSSLPDDTEDCSDSSSDSEDEGVAGGATSTPQCAHGKSAVASSLLSDISGHFTSHDESKLGTSCLIDTVAKDHAYCTQGNSVGCETSSAHRVPTELCSGHQMSQKTDTDFSIEGECTKHEQRSAKSEDAEHGTVSGSDKDSDFHSQRTVFKEPNLNTSGTCNKSFEVNIRGSTEKPQNTDAAVASCSIGFGHSDSITHGVSLKDSRAKTANENVSLKLESEELSFREDCLETSTTIQEVEIKRNIDTAYACHKGDVGDNKHQLNTSHSSNAEPGDRTFRIDPNDTCPETVSNASELKVKTAESAEKIHKVESVDAEVQCVDTDHNLGSCTESTAEVMETNNSVNQELSPSRQLPEQAIPGPTVPPLSIKPNTEYDVQIETIESPWLLWVLPFREEDLDNLIERMSLFHDQLNPSDPAARLDRPPVVGMYVCCKFSADNTWYRALVTHVYKPTGGETTPSKVRVFYIDFGNSEDCNIRELRPLPEEFAKLPANAVPCALAEVVPLADGRLWTEQETMNILLDLRKNQTGALKSALFTYEENSPTWFVRIHIPIGPKLKSSTTCQNSYTQDLLDFSEQLVIANQARKMPNEDVVKCMRDAYFPDSIVFKSKYPVLQALGHRRLISKQSPVRQMNNSKLDKFSTAAGDAEKEKTKSKEEKKERSDHDGGAGDSGRKRVKSGDSSVSQNSRRRSRGRRTPTSKCSNGAKDSPLRNIQSQGERHDSVQETPQDSWHQAWKKPQHTDKDMEKSIPCSSSLARRLQRKNRNAESSLSPEPGKNIGHTSEELMQENKKGASNSDKRARGIGSACISEKNPSKKNPGEKFDIESDHETSKDYRPTSDHYHHRIPSPEVSIGEDLQIDFLMAHIESPHRFFIHPVYSHEQLSKLPKELATYYATSKSLTSMQLYFKGTELEVGDACVAKFTEDNNFYRAEVLQTSDRSDKRMVEVLYVDYGNREWVSIDRIFPIQPKLLSIPAQAICCQLDSVQPIGGEAEVTMSHRDCGGWLKAAVNWFEKNTGYEKALTGYVDKPATKSYSMDSPLRLLVVDQTADLIINLELARLGWAQVNQLPEVSKIATESTVKKSTSGSNNRSSPMDTADDSGMGLEEWRPMEEDYLSMRNSYQVDTEDAGVAVTGYKSTGDKNICTFYARGIRCWLGADCPYEHVRPDPEFITDKKEALVMYAPENVVEPPEPNSWVRIEVSAVINPGRFYAFLPYGPMAVHVELEPTSIAEEFKKMLEIMSEFYEENPFKHQDLTLYAVGEVVAVKSNVDCMWHRCRVIEHDPDRGQVKVFFLDYGNTEHIDERNVKQMDTQFQQIPFQAIECFLEIKPNGDSWSNEAIQAFADFVDGKELIAQVCERRVTGMTLEVYDTSKEGVDIDVAQHFVEHGYAKYIRPANSATGGGSTSSSPSRHPKNIRMVPG